MMKYSLSAPNDGDTMTVSAGGGGWESPVNDNRKGGNGDNASRGNSGSKNTPKILFTDGPIVTVKDGIRYVGIIVDSDTGQFIDWSYDGLTNRTNDNTQQGAVNFGRFGSVRYEDKERVKDALVKGDIVGPGLIREKSIFIVLANRYLAKVYLENNQPGLTVFYSSLGRLGLNKNIKLAAEAAARTKVSDFLRAEEFLAQEKLPSVFALQGTPAVAASSQNAMQFSVSGGSGVAVSTEERGWLTKNLSDFWAALSQIATASTVGPITAALTLLTYSPKVGVGSDQVPGRDPEMMFSMPLRDLPGNSLPDNLAELASSNGMANLPFRAAFVKRNGEVALNMFKTGTSQVPAGVKVIEGIFDKETGTFRVDIDGVPGRIILESPAKAPTAGVGNTGSPVTGNQVPTHTGYNVKPVGTLTVTTTPTAKPVAFEDYIIWTPSADETGVEAIYVVFSNPYGETNATGKYSGRDYNTNKAGGPIQDLDWRTATIDRAGVDQVKLHTGRFGEIADNKVMIERLEKILKGDIPVTDIDKRFYTHEIRELERYRNLGIKDGSILSNSQERNDVWNSTHTATLEDYKINEKEQPLYTDEALKAGDEQDTKDVLGGKNG